MIYYLFICNYWATPAAIQRVSNMPVWYYDISSLTTSIRFFKRWQMDNVLSRELNET